MTVSTEMYQNTETVTGLRRGDDQVLFLRAKTSKDHIVVLHKLYILSTNKHSHIDKMSLPGVSSWQLAKITF